MSYHVTCGTCRHRNPLGRLYCAKCGARLEVTEQTVRPETGSLQRLGGGLARLLRFAVALGLLFALVQVLRPLPPQGQSGTVQHGMEFVQKVELLRYAVLERRGMTQEFTEPEINGHLARVLADTPDRAAEGLLKFELQLINVRFVQGEVVTVMLSSWQSINLTYEVRVRPVRGEDGMTLELLGARLGHLPLPMPLARTVATRLAHVFSGMEDDKRLLDQLSALEVKDGVAVATTPGL